MIIRKLISLAAMLGVFGANYVCAQQPQSAGAVAPAGVEKLGKVNFPTSCDPKVQAEFERGVAMLHSYWFNYAGKTFRGILQQDPNCAMAYWGVAVDLLGNSLAFPPSLKDAQAAADGCRGRGKLRVLSAGGGSRGGSREVRLL